MQCSIFWFSFHRSLFPGIQLTINSHWFKEWLASKRRQTIHVTNTDPAHWGIHAKQGGYELTTLAGMYIKWKERTADVRNHHEYVMQLMNTMKIKNKLKQHIVLQEFDLLFCTVLENSPELLWTGVSLCEIHFRLRWRTVYRWRPLNFVLDWKCIFV